jgi:hypothetical protein
MEVTVVPIYALYFRVFDRQLASSVVIIPSSAQFTSWQMCLALTGVGFAVLRKYKTPLSIGAYVGSIFVMANFCLILWYCGAFDCLLISLFVAFVLRICVDSRVHIRGIRFVIVLVVFICL